MNSLTTHYRRSQLIALPVPAHGHTVTGWERELSV